MKRLTSLIFAVVMALTSLSLSSCLRDADETISAAVDEGTAEDASSTIKNIVTENTDAEAKTEPPVVIDNVKGDELTATASWDLSFYAQKPDDGSYSRTMEYTTDFASAKEDGSPFDLAVLGLIPSADESLPAYAYRDVWISEAEKEGVKMDDAKASFTVSYQLKSGDTEVYEVAGPSDAEKVGDVGHIELYLYDDVHQEPGARYSHLTEDSLNDWVVVTTVKVTAGEKVDEVEQIFLTARLAAKGDASDFGTSTVVIKRPSTDSADENDD